MREVLLVKVFFFRKTPIMCVMVLVIGVMLSKRYCYLDVKMNHDSYS